MSEDLEQKHPVLGELRAKVGEEAAALNVARGQAFAVDAHGDGYPWRLNHAGCFQLALKTSGKYTQIEFSREQVEQLNDDLKSEDASRITRAWAELAPRIRAALTDTLTGAVGRAWGA